MAYIVFSGGHHVKVAASKDAIGNGLRGAHQPGLTLREHLPGQGGIPLVPLEVDGAEVLINPNQVAYVIDDMDFEELVARRGFGALRLT